MNAQHIPVTADTALFSFYDIESLTNVFSLVVYTPFTDGPDRLEVFYLVDDEADGTNLADTVDVQTMGRHIFSSNPGLPAFPATQATFFDLRREDSNHRLAMITGLSDAEQVNHHDSPTSYPGKFRPICDTDTEYDPAQHPFLAGYNSALYDTTMLALYLYEVFGNHVDFDDRVTNAHTQITRLERLRSTAGLTPGTAQDLVDWRVRLQDELASGQGFRRTKAATLRNHNDALFQHLDYMPGYLGWDGPAAKIRRAMMHSGRHLDVARLNELQYKVGLKRLLGMLGRQIKESEKLSHNTKITSPEDLYELLAYNVSDCLGLAQLFRHPTYASNFDLKASLLAQYPETVYTKSGAVRRDRLTIDSSSAKFVGRILAPYTALEDDACVSFVYPAPEVARERGVEPVNVLDECVKFFETHVAPDPAANPTVTPAQTEAHRRFMQVVTYYRSIEGQNFNDSDEYRAKFDRPAQSLHEIPKAPNNVPYFNADGTPSSCFATFSTGGIHGAEADMDTFAAEQAEYEAHSFMLRLAKHLYPDARDFVAEAKEQHSRLTLPDGTTVDKRLVLLGSDSTKVKYRKAKKNDPVQAAQLARAQELVDDPAALLATQRPADEALDVLIPDSRSPHGHYRIRGKVVLATTSATKATYRDEPAKRPPQLFTTQEDNSTKLHPKYARTSAAVVIHEDFTSYYPGLLRNMRAFYNPELGEDRYAQIFFDKERYGFQMKQPGTSDEEKSRLNTLRNGTKLILNAASGAGDARHRTPIRMNNRIISMRIIGQLFSWRIGQAQTLAGARIISTNTDGLYSVVGGTNGFDVAANNRVLAEQQDAIGIDIEPELMFLISKDSNNRLELAAPEHGGTVADSTILAASGGTLACHAGPTPTKSLAHPAVLDFALARYLQTVASRGEAALADPFDPELGRKMIEEALDLGDPVQTLLLFQNVIAASRSSITYPFAAEPISSQGDDSTKAEAELLNPRALQMVNRVFIVRAGTEDAVSLHNAGAWKVTPISQAKRRESGSPGIRRDPVALAILRHHGWATSRADASSSDGLALLPDDQDVMIRRIAGIDPSWSMIVVNDDLRTLSTDRITRIITSLDLDIYTRMLEETFTKNWRNTAG
ncbi:hypothetical protein [Streptomyces sp. NRRL F-5053]|uniref:hypothetical protein n=1 Tax=Streptomyces sp. NRRL F-5053 TaxID=1463854 RepID=UPI0004C95A2E|nr:hypothetical protein [Streptomyces sp. NRRL F-5053]